jgi:tetratricopeptide (TPR) repeat protein
MTALNCPRPSLALTSTARWLLAAGLLLCGLAKAQSVEPAPTRSDMDAPLFYQLLIGELELQRGEVGTAYQVLLDAARRTQDEALFRRCVNIAVQARAGNEAIGAAKAWRAAVPRSQEARRTHIQLLSALGQLAELPEPLLAWLADAPLGSQVAMLDTLPQLLRAAGPSAFDVMSPGLIAVRDDPKTSTARRSLAAATLAELALLARNPELARNQLGQALADAPDSVLPRWLALDLMRWSPDVEALVTPGLTDAGLRLAYARTLARDSRTAEALAQFQALLALQPEQIAHHYAIATLELELRHPQAALDAATTYLAQLDAAPAPSSAAPNTTRDAARLVQAQAHEQLRNFPAATAALDAVTNEDRSFEVSYRRAAIEARQGQLAKARARLQALPADTPEAAHRRLLAETQLLRDAGDWRSAHDLLTAALPTADGEHLPDLLYEQAMTAERLGQFDLMEQQLRRVIELRPSHHHSYNALGYSLADRNLRLPEARQLIERAIELGGHEPFLIDSLGWVAFREGNLAEAERDLRQAYRARPDAEIAAHLGEVLWVQGAKEEARQVLDLALQREPDHAALRATRQRLGL